MSSPPDLAPHLPSRALPLGPTLVPWLLGLRWAVIALLSGTLVASARWLDLPVRWSIAVPTVGALALVNAWLSARRTSTSAWTANRIALSVLFDMVAIAAVLAASGGAANPFSSLLFVYVALAASLLPPRITISLAAVSALTFGALFLVPQDPTCPGCAARGAHEDGSFSSHLYGMWVSYALGATLVVWFLTRVRAALEGQARRLEALQKRADDSAKFAAVGTLAAGAAHELGTPLGTIAVLAGELSQDRDASPAAHEAAFAIAAQVERCREVLRRMHPGAFREGAGDAVLGETVVRAVETWRAAHPNVSVVVGRAEDLVVPLSGPDLEAALTVLLDNALYATNKAESAAPIVVEAGSSPSGPCMTVIDGGIGVPRDVAARMGQPFLTTKEPGEGMGLGLYIVRSLLEHVGGRLEVSDNAPVGTRVALFLGGGAVAP